MKAAKIIYWVSTAIVGLMMVFSAYSYVTNPEVAQGFHHLGFPDYFRVELATAKVLGAIILLIPITGPAKEWAYAGFTITFISASIAHTFSGDPVMNRFMPMVFLAILAVSYVYYHKLKKPYAAFPEV